MVGNKYGKVMQDLLKKNHIQTYIFNIMKKTFTGSECVKTKIMHFKIPVLQGITL